MRLSEGTDGGAQRCRPADTWCRPGDHSQDSERSFEFSREDIGVDPILQPPCLLAPDVTSRCGGKPNATLLQRERSSRRISSASTRWPAATSASDWRKASCRAARSASSSQSPGSNGSSSISVPSGRSVGSSRTNRPDRTRALIVIAGSVALKGPPNKALHPTPAASLARRGRRG
jgi:hypothetical protein